MIRLELAIIPNFYSYKKNIYRQNKTDQKNVLYKLTNNIIISNGRKEWCCILMMNPLIIVPIWSSTMNKRTTNHDKTINWKNNLHHWIVMDHWLAMISVTSVIKYQFGWYHQCDQKTKPSIKWSNFWSQIFISLLNGSLGMIV